MDNKIPGTYEDGMDPLAALMVPITNKKSLKQNSLEEELKRAEKKILGVIEPIEDKPQNLTEQNKNGKARLVQPEYPFGDTQKMNRNPFLIVNELSKKEEVGKANKLNGNVVNQLVINKTASENEYKTPKSANGQSQRTLEDLGFSSEEIIPGEERVNSARSVVTLLQQTNAQLEGLFVITNYRIIFKPNDINYYNFVPLNNDYLKIPLGFISKIETSPDKKDPNSFSIDIYSKDGRQFKIKPVDLQSGDFSISKDLQIYSFPDKREYFFAFSYNKAKRDLEDTYQGWKIYDIEREFNRQGIDFMSLQNNGDYSNKSLFRIVDNRNFQICTTYPNLLLVPSRISDQAIITSSKFRTKERLPVITYYYAKKGTLLSRSSQSKPGLVQNRCIPDELLLRYLGNPSYDEAKDQDSNDINLYIFDARPYINAMANRVNGKGFEDTKWYKNCEIDFMEIDNIHHVRDAHKKIMNLCYNSESSNPKWYSQLDSAHWLQMISKIMAAGSQVAQHLQEGKNCLVHCSDGWDRTAQILSLAQIMLDPYFRTIEGFEVLVMKEWVSFGHQFNMRMGHGNRHEKDDQRAPVFLQFLDCVQQLLHQYPFAFEFNQEFLLDLAYHSYSCQFGTFLCNTYQEILLFQLEAKTISIWSFLNSQKEKYINIYYDSVIGHEDMVLRPSNHLKYLKLWEEHFLYFSRLSQPNYSLSGSFSFCKDFYEEILRREKQKSAALEAENQELRKKLNIPSIKRLNNFGINSLKINEKDDNEQDSQIKSEDELTNFNAYSKQKSGEIKAVNLEGSRIQAKLKDNEEAEIIKSKEKHGQFENGERRKGIRE